MADTLRDLAYGAVLRGQMPPQPLRLPDTIQRLAMRQDAIGTPQRGTIAGLVGDAGSTVQRLAEALSNYSAPIPMTDNRRISLKDLTLGDAGQVIEDWSYGSPPTTGGNYATGGVGTLGAQPRAMDLFNLGGVAGGAAKAGRVGADVLGPTLREMARKGIEGNMRATGGHMFVVPEGFKGTRSELWDDGTLVEFGPSPFPKIPRQVEMPKGRSAATETEVRLDDLHSSQSEITRNGLEKPRNDSAGLPLVVKSNDVLYIQDGHHRLAAQKFAGDQKAKVRLIDLDNQTGGRPLR